MIKEFILKIEEDCNLRCTYCYMYHIANRLWLTRPPRMSDEVIIASAVRIGEYAGDTPVRIILHGGEPLLAGAERIRWICQAMRSRITNPVFSMQTNGTLLTEENLRMAAIENIRIGISTDGTPEAHDASRRNKAGRGSYDAMAEGLGRLGSERYRHLYGGLLCVINAESDPVETYEALMAHRPPRIDFLLPLATNLEPPARPGEHANWLIRVFGRWYGDPGQDVRIRIFENIMRRVVTGRAKAPDADMTASLVIESDGSMELVDSLKSAYEGASVTGLSVFSDTISDAEAFVSAFTESRGISTLPHLCRACPVQRACGAGGTSTRWDGETFANPSAYCLDLMKLIIHIHGRVRRDLATAGRDMHDAASPRTSAR